MNFSPGLNFMEKVMSKVAVHVPGDCVVAGTKFVIRMSLVSHCDCAFLAKNDSAATANRTRRAVFILLWLRVKKIVYCIAGCNTFSEGSGEFLQKD